MNEEEEEKGDSNPLKKLTHLINYIAGSKNHLKTTQYNSIFYGSNLDDSMANSMGIAYPTNMR